MATGRAPKTGARRIFEALKHQILRRVYEAGSQLPSLRRLANELHVSRTTVTVVYEQLAAEGFLELRQGARPRVTALQLRQRPRDIKAAALAFDMLTARLGTLHSHTLNSGYRRSSPLVARSHPRDLPDLQLADEVQAPLHPLSSTGNGLIPIGHTLHDRRPRSDVRRRRVEQGNIATPITG